MEFLKTAGPTATILIALAAFATLTHTQHSDIRTELRQDIASTRTELRQDIASMRTDLHQDIASMRTDLHQEIESTRNDLRREIHASRTELVSQIEGLRQSVGDLTGNFVLHLEAHAAP